MSYMARKNDVPTEEQLLAEYTTLQEELYAKTLFVGPDFDQDNVTFYGWLLQMTKEGKECTEAVLRFKSTQDGRAALKAIVRIANGADAKQKLTKDILRVRDGARFNGMSGQFLFATYAEIHRKSIRLMTDNECGEAPFMQVRALLAGIQCEALENSIIMANLNPTLNSDFEAMVAYLDGMCTGLKDRNKIYQGRSSGKTRQVLELERQIAALKQASGRTNDGSGGNRGGGAGGGPPKTGKGKGGKGNDKKKTGSDKAPSLEGRVYGPGIPGIVIDGNTSFNKEDFKNLSKNQFEKMIQERTKAGRYIKAVSTEGARSVMGVSTEHARNMAKVSTSAEVEATRETQRVSIEDGTAVVLEDKPMGTSESAKAALEGVGVLSVIDENGTTGSSDTEKAEKLAAFTTVDHGRKRDAARSNGGSQFGSSAERAAKKTKKTTSKVATTEQEA
jgi:hypothetical protein